MQCHSGVSRGVSCRVVEVVLKMMIIAELFIVMTRSSG